MRAEEHASSLRPCLQGHCLQTSSCDDFGDLSLILFVTQMLRAGGEAGREIRGVLWRSLSSQSGTRHQRELQSAKASSASAGLGDSAAAPSTTAVSLRIATEPRIGEDDILIQGTETADACLEVRVFLLPDLRIRQCHVLQIVVLHESCLHPGCVLHQQQPDSMFGPIPDQTADVRIVNVVLSGGFFSSATRNKLEHHEPRLPLTAHMQVVTGFGPRRLIESFFEQLYVLAIKPLQPCSNLFTLHRRRAVDLDTQEDAGSNGTVLRQEQRGCRRKRMSSCIPQLPGCSGSRTTLQMNA